MTSQDDLDFLRDFARKWVSAECSAVPDPTLAGPDPKERWLTMAELGWSGMLVPEELGGSGLGLKAYGVLAEELGRELVISPMLSTGLIATLAFADSKSVKAREALSAIAGGQLIVGFAHDEGPHSGAPLTSVAAESGANWHLKAKKQYVLDGAVAHAVLVSANADGEPALFLVSSEQAEIQSIETIDGRRFAHVTVEGDAECILRGRDELSRLEDLGRLALASEMVGAARRCLEITIEYLKTRQQFGRAIGSFQALQHRAAQVLVETELAAASVAAAWTDVEQGGDDLISGAALGKFMAGKALHRAAREMIQMHGGIGMTADHVAGNYLKWGEVSQRLFGGDRILVDRYAKAHGF